MTLLRLILTRALLGVLGLLPLRRISRRLKPEKRVRLWRSVALAAASKRGPDQRKYGGQVPSGKPLDLLLVSDALFPERGGGTRSLMKVARKLMAAGWNVAGVCHGVERRKLHVAGMALHWIPELGELDDLIPSLKPRRMLLQQIWAPMAGEIARAHGVPYWYFIRSTEELSGEMGTVLNEADLIETIKNAADAKTRLVSALVGGAERVVANSQFVARLISGGFGRGADVLYPEVDEPMPWETRRNPVARAIVAVATTKKKGVDIMFELARAFPDELFLLCGFKALTRYKMKLIRVKAVRNIVPLGRLPTPATYALAKLVLVPSQWPEPFGRVNAEAVLRGIPVLSSRTGGIPEVITSDSLLVTDFTSPEAWAASIARLRERRALKALRPAVAECAMTYAAMLKENEAVIQQLMG